MLNIYMLNIKENFIKYFKNTRLLALSGIFLGLLLVFFMLPMGMTVILASIFFVIFCKREETLAHMVIKKYQILHFNLLFFILCIINGILLYSDMYHRPLMFFIITSIIFALLGVEILFCLGNSKSQLNLILLKVLISSFIVYLSVLLTSNSLIGVDIWYHRNIVLDLLENGHIPNVGRYSHFPIYHLIVSICSLITNLEFKESVTFSIGIIYSFSLIFMYLLGKMLYNDQFGLISTLFIAFTSYHIQRGYWLIPQSLGISLFFIVLYLLIKSMNFSSSFKFFLIIFVIVLNMTHNLSVLMIFVALIILYVCVYFFNFVLDEDKYRLSQNFIFLYFVMMFFYWTYIYYIYPFLTHVSARKMTLESAPIISYDVPTLIVNQFGFLLFVFLSILGFLYGLSRKRLSTINYSLMSASFLLLLLIEIFRFANIEAVVPQRWIAFASILLAFPASFGIIFLKSFRINHKRLFIASILFLFSFFMITSTVANNDSPIYSKEQTESFGLRNSEIRSANTINNSCIGKISTDTVYSLYFSYYLKNSEVAGLNNMSDIIVFRESVWQNNKYFKNYRNYDLKQYNFSNDHDRFKIYESNSVYAYFTLQK